MEDTLREQFFSYRLHLQSLNPCFNGRYSQRQLIKGSELGAYKVLILVLMEDTLRESKDLCPFVYRRLTYVYPCRDDFVNRN